MFDEAGCECLEKEYKSPREPWRFLCVCGNQGQQRPSDFKRGRRCQVCGAKNLALSQRVSIEAVQERFKGLPETLQRVYFREAQGGAHGRTMVEYLCKRGHTVNQVLHSFDAGNRCKECSLIEARERYSLGIDSVSRELEEMGLKLLDTDYVNMDLPIRYLCECGREAIGYLGALRKGVRCGCKVLKGEKNPNWNHTLSLKERERKRKYEEYWQWVKNVYERDEYTCQKCKLKGVKLHSHHINSYANFPEQRTDVNNGITLCEYCHRDFHWEYGYKDFTMQDFFNYMNW